MKKEKARHFFNGVFIVILILFPLRHAAYGIDWRDVGYNYVNFLNFGTSHMDPMWMFSTYAATLAGHWMTMLPFGHTLVGLNIYTGLVLSSTAVISYRYVVRRFGIGIVPAFLGELLAECFCWCPTAMLYNYLSYFLLVLCVIFLEKGLSEKRNRFLILAGAMLGINVLVRFSNLPEAVLIIGVWAVGFLEYRAGDKKENTKRHSIRLTLLWTIYCMAGYFGSLLMILGIIAVKYGAGSYFQGIIRLLSMPEEAADYTVYSMLYSIYASYVNELIWIVRIGLFAVCGVAGAWIGGAAVRKFAGASAGSRIERIVVMFFSFAASIAMVIWIYGSAFVSFNYRSYDSMINPAVLFLMSAEVFFLGMVLLPGINLRKKTVSGFVLLVLIVSSVGSNNGAMSGINNLFLAAPLLVGWFCDGLNKKGEYVDRRLPLTPVKAISACLLMVCLIQGLGFAGGFIFAEGTGITGELVENTSLTVLSGVRLQPDRNESLTRISEVIDQAHLQDTEVLVYGNIPSAAFYLGLTPVFNPWPDLRSYSLDAFGKAMEDMWDSMDKDASYRPMILLNKDLKILGEMKEELAGTKIAMVFETVDKYGYLPIYEDEFFVLYGSISRE